MRVIFCCRLGGFGCCSCGRGWTLALGIIFGRHWKGCQDDLKVLGGFFTLKGVLGHSFRFDGIRNYSFSCVLLPYRYLNLFGLPRRAVGRRKDLDRAVLARISLLGSSFNLGAWRD